MMPPYPGCAQINKPDSQVTQCSDQGIQALGHLIMPVFMVTYSNPSANQIITLKEPCCVSWTEGNFT